MAIREVLVSFTFEQQRLMLNLIGADVGDASLLLTPTNVVVTAINEVITGDVDLSNQTIGMDDGTLASPSLFWDAGQGFYKVDANKLGLSTSLAVAGNLEVDGDITFRAGSGTGGTLTFGDLDTDNIVINADVQSSIVPDSTANYNLGSSTKQWNDLWIDGTASIDTLEVDLNTTLTGNLSVNSGIIKVDPSTVTTATIFNDYVTTASVLMGATDITIGANVAGSLAIRNDNITTSRTSINVFNTIATTVNAFGAASSVTTGLSTFGSTGVNSNFNIRSDDTVLDGDLNVNGGELLSSQNTFDLLISNSDVRIGAANAAGETVINNSLKVSENVNLSNSGTNITIKDNTTNALAIKEGSNTYVQLQTTDSSERIIVYKDLYVVGNLDISGSSTVIDTTTLTVEDKNIELGSSASPSDATADGGGITLKGTTDKTITYNNTSGSWETNIGFNVAGNLGIGTTSPSEPLTLHGNFKINTSATDGNEQRALFNAGGSGDPFSITMYGADATTVGTTISGNGSATFAGAVTLGTAAPAGQGTILYNTATTVRRDDGSTVYEVFRNGATLSDRTIILNSDGNATFGGTVTSNGITQYTLPTIGNGGQLGYDDGTKSLRLYANSSTSADAKIQFHFNQSATAGMTFDQSGAMEFPGQAVSSVGNLVVKTSSSFNHYEVGTFIPYYGNAITSPVYTSPNFNGGNYIRIGNLLYYWITICATGTNTGNSVAIFGLPYAPAGTEGGNSSFAYNTGFFTTGFTMPNIYISGQSGSAVIQFYETGSGTSVKGNWYNGLSGAHLYFGGVYRV